ncbi:MAG: 30S ribosomal protein THX [Chitinophagaceae bacterium]|nr:30S ribosomal protein THX [Chitinophagaceae bacterium]
MGRGDKRTVKGKRTKGSFGVCRPARAWQTAKAKTRKPE